MGIQIDEGDFTRLHNTILEKLALARFTASEYRCLMFLFRMTYGWQKKEDAISLSQWATGIGLDPEKYRHNALRTLQGLIAKRVIYTKDNGNNKPATWGFNKHFDEWDGSLFDPSVITGDNTSVMPGDNSPAPSVITPDNRCVITHDNKTVITGDNHQRKERKERKERENAPARIASQREPANKELHYKSPYLDPRHFVNGYIPPGTGINAVEVYYERFSINQDSARLNAIKEDDLAKLCPDLAKLREVITAYSRTAFQLGNVQLILDWYSGGIPEKHKPPGANSVYTNGVMSQAKKDALRTSAQLARQSLESATKFKTPVDPQWQRTIDTAKAAGVI